MEAIGLFITLEVRRGKEADAEAFLKSAQPRRAREAQRAARRELAGLVRSAHGGGAGGDRVADVSDYLLVSSNEKETTI